MERKSIDWSYVQDLLAVSKESNQWTNFGPLTLKLEKKLEFLLELPDYLRVVMTSSGSAAIYGLKKLIEYFYKENQFRWVTSSFNFPIGFGDIVDCDERGLLSRPKDYEAAIFINPFGVIQDYGLEDWDQYVIVDNAGSFYQQNRHDWEIMSFHHTKPWGFGEGGCAILPYWAENTFRSIINFGRSNEKLLDFGFNGKMSDVTAAFIYQRLSQVEDLEKRYIEQYKRILKIAKNFGFVEFVDRLGFLRFPMNVPLIGKKPMIHLRNPYVVLHKYYKPLKNTPNASRFYDSIVNFPCHCDLESVEDRFIESCFISILKQN